MGVHFVLDLTKISDLLEVAILLRIRTGSRSKKPLTPSQFDVKYIYLTIIDVERTNFDDVKEQESIKRESTSKNRF